MSHAFVLLAAIVSGAGSGQDARNVVPAPCATSTPSCVEWVALGGGPARSLIYRSYPLGTRNDRIQRALIMVHGTNRNADRYFGTAMAAAFLARALEDTLVIAPRFSACNDKPEPNEVLWSCSGDSWRSGGAAASHAELSSFDLVDEILRRLAIRSTFPNMRAIVVAGHSAGGQYANRYGMSNRVHDTLAVPVSYVVANPSSYAWPDPARVVAADDADAAAAKEGWNTMDVHTKFAFGQYDAAKCRNFNQWPLGLENRTAGYTAKMSNEVLVKQLVSRPVTYLLGQVDTLPLGGFDSSCPAMAQGPTRRARGEAFVKFVNETLGARHRVLIVSECGHNDRCIYTTDAVLPFIFPTN